MTVLAVILARGGSKGIPKKNSRKLCGTPLVEWCTRAAINSSLIDYVLLSSDESKILDIGRSLGCEVHERSPEDAGDSVSSEQSLMAAIREHHVGEDAETILLVQPTSPFVSASDFDAALDQFASGNYDSMFTAVDSHSFFWKLEEDGSATPSYDPKRRPMRQDMKNKRVENGAFYIMKRQLLEDRGCRLGGRMGCYTMPDHTGTEIDNELDWAIVESIAEQLQLLPERLD